MSSSKQIGILVGSDLTLEWILPWWWHHYQKNNTIPVAFIDLGLSFEMKEWCRARGELIPLRIFDFAAAREEMDPVLVERFECEYGEGFWESRGAWFKKPFACLASPFERSLWIDIDCEVRGAVAPLFDYPGLAMAKDQIALNLPYPVYNSGVLLFRRGEKWIADWAEEAKRRHDQFRGDQELLSWMIAQKKGQVTELPAIYNWSRTLEDNERAVIYHWHGNGGKGVIRHQMAMWNLDSSFSR